MRDDQHLAIKLRKKGVSYNRIQRELGIPKSTICSWFKNEAWSENIKKELNRKALYIAKKRLRSINKSRREEWEKLHRQSQEQAQKEFPSLLKNPLFVAGINIYWGEGDSKLKNGILRMSNTDPRMINIFVSFLKNIIKVPDENIKIGLILYPDLSESKCKNFWKNITKIPIQKFYKTQFIKGKHPTKKLSYGICMIIISSRNYKEKVIKWIDLFSQKYGR
jgi:hypothetical protein